MLHSVIFIIFSLMKETWVSQCRIIYRHYNVSWNKRNIHSSDIPCMILISAEIFQTVPHNTYPHILLVSIQFSSVLLLSHVRHFMTPCTVAHQASLPNTNFRNLLKLISIESVMPSSYLILCHPLILLPSIFPGLSIFSKKSVLQIK